MSRSLLGEIAHQIFYTPPKHKRSDNHSGSKHHSQRDYAFEKQSYKHKQRAFENRKNFEILKLKNKGMGLL